MLRALAWGSPEPSIGGNPPTWLCDRQLYTPLVACAYKFTAVYEIHRSHVGPPISSRATPRLTPSAQFVALLACESPGTAVLRSGCDYKGSGTARRNRVALKVLHRRSSCCATTPRLTPSAKLWLRSLVNRRERQCFVAVTFSTRAFYALTYLSCFS